MSPILQAYWAFGDNMHY